MDLNIIKIASDTSNNKVKIKTGTISNVACALGSYANTTQEIGLINRIVKEKDLKEETLKVARIIESKSTATVAIGKEAFYKQLEMGI